MDVTISQAGFCGVCCVCFAVGMFVGAYLIERLGCKGDEDGTGKDEP